MSIPSERTAKELAAFVVSLQNRSRTCATAGNARFMERAADAIIAQSARIRELTDVIEHRLTHEERLALAKAKTDGARLRLWQEYFHNSERCISELERELAEARAELVQLWCPRTLNLGGLVLGCRGELGHAGDCFYSRALPVKP